MTRERLTIRTILALSVMFALPGLVAWTHIAAEGIDEHRARIMVIQHGGNFDDVENDDVPIKVSILRRIVRVSLIDASLSVEDCRRLARLSHVHTLDLTGTLVEPGGWKELAKMPALQRLTIHESSADDTALASLAPLTRIEFLGAGATRVTDAGLQKLYGWQNMRHCVVDECDVSDEAREQLQKVVSNLQFKPVCGVWHRGADHFCARTAAHIQTDIDRILGLARLPRLIPRMALVNT